MRTLKSFSPSAQRKYKRPCSINKVCTASAMHSSLKAQQTIVNRNPLIVVHLSCVVIVTYITTLCLATGEGIAKLKTMLTAAQEAHPVVPEVSRHSHTFKHPYAKPEAAPSAPPAAVAVAAADEQQAETMQDDGSSDESPAPKRRARTASDLEAVAMNDVSTSVLYFKYTTIGYSCSCHKMR
jgi:hypothetical protein